MSELEAPRHYKGKEGTDLPWLLFGLRWNWFFVNDSIPENDWWGNIFRKETKIYRLIRVDDGIKLGFEK